MQLGASFFTYFKMQLRVKRCNLTQLGYSKVLLGNYCCCKILLSYVQYPINVLLSVKGVVKTLFMIEYTPLKLQWATTSSPHGPSSKLTQMGIITWEGYYGNRGISVRFKKEIFKKSLFSKKICMEGIF